MGPWLLSMTTGVLWLSAASSCFSPAFSLVAWVSLEEGGDLLSTVYLIFFQGPAGPLFPRLSLPPLRFLVCFDGIHTSNVLHPPCIPLYVPAPIYFTRSYNFAGQQSVR